MALCCLYTFYVKVQCALSELGFHKSSLGERKTLGTMGLVRKTRKIFTQVTAIFISILKLDN